MTATTVPGKPDSSSYAQYEPGTPEDSDSQMLPTLPTRPEVLEREACKEGIIMAAPAMDFPDKIHGHIECPFRDDQ